MMSRSNIVPLVIGVLLSAAAAAAQSHYGEYPRSALLLAQRAEIALKESRLRMDRAGELIAAELISEQEYEQAQLEHQAARVDYQNYLLQALSERSHVVIRKAVKRRGTHGGSRVDLELEHAVSPLPDGFMEEGTLAKLLEAPLRNVFVSLEAAGTNVGDPYEARIDELAPGRVARRSIRLLRDCDELSVILRYGGRVEKRTIILLRDAADDAIALVCPQSSQEADLGAVAEYSLSLERFTDRQASVPLAIQGLPSEIGRTFVDPATGARVNQAAFTGGEAVCELTLRLYLPERLSERVLLDESIPFQVLVDGKEAIGPGSDEPTNLVLIPRGVPRLEIAAPNLFLQTDHGSPAHSDMVVTNSGTKRLDGIQISVQSPMGWSAQIEPATIDTLAPGEKRSVRLDLTPAADSPGGEYEAKVRASTLSESRVIETDYKVIRIRLGDESPILGSVALAGGFLALVGGIVVAGVRLSRR